MTHEFTFLKRRSPTFRDQRLLADLERERQRGRVTDEEYTEALRRIADRHERPLTRRDLPGS